jgi:serine/threonine-protein kinase
LTADSCFCPRCGTEQEQGTRAPTETSAGDPASRDSLDQARFLPGTLLTERYRIVGLLGRGGMGEVYRADDLKLGQPVALKFLPEALEDDPSRLSRLLGEVRLARQVSHPNVCRVYDIDELSGSHFMAMEYVDGEDLASLLRRIGRLPQEKALEIARQICAGLAAAHEQGILHRDLKPANVMLDGRGRVKLTDFGLAGLDEGIEAGDIRSGTPAYMSPEQLAGREVTQRSDIYSLGLVLYEIFTGKRPFDGKTVAEIAQQQQQTVPTSPSSHVSDMDEIVEQVILRCLEKEPGARPMSALAVSAALPGGDPLAAALAAGETPSPEMVAEAGRAGGLRPALAVGALFAIVVSVGLAMLTSWQQLHRYVPLDTPPDKLAGEALRLLDELGVDEPGPHRRRGFLTNTDYLEWVEDRDTSSTRWDAMATGRPPGAEFWFRYSADELIPADVHAFSVSWNDPPPYRSGEGRVRLDLGGHLLGLEVWPSTAVEPREEPFDWAALFEAAGLDIAAFHGTNPIRGPSAPCGELRAWTGPVFGEIEGTVQACRLGGAPTYFEILAPWDLESAGDSLLTRIKGLVVIVSIVAAAGALILAQRNLRAGRSDRKGAIKIMAFFVATIFMPWILVEVRLATLDPGSLLSEVLRGRLLAHGLLHGLLVGVLYVGLEPYVRRLWPETLVSWSRLLLGRLRDPLVGRDVLVGMAVMGVVVTAIRWIGSRVGQILEYPVPLSGDLLSPMLDGTRQAVALVPTILQGSVALSLILLVLLLLLRLLLRRTWAAVAACLALPAVVGLARPGLPIGLKLIVGLSFLLFIAVLIACMLRLGLLSVIGAAFLTNALLAAPLTTDFSRWYAGPALVSVFAVMAVALWAFYISLAGRKLFRDSVLGEG